jgi:hypothetical protein
MNCNSNKKNIDKQSLETVLKDLGLSVDELKSLLNEPPKPEPSETQMYFSFFETPESNTQETPSNDVDKLSELFMEIFSIPSAKTNKVEKTQFKSPAKTHKDTQTSGRVSFFPGQSADTCRVSVNGGSIAGVLSASLDYDAEVNMPVLHLEIYDPEIVTSLDKIDM